VTVDAPGAVAPQEPEYRRDPVTGRWVVIAPERSRRPMALAWAEPRHRPDAERRPCPFCPGSEYDTPNEVYALREPGTAADGPGWRLRVVPNKFPAVRHGLNLAPTPEGPGTSVPGLSTPAYGAHEVVIETPEHVSNPTALSDDALRDALDAFRARLLAHAADPRLVYASVFKNVGAEAGASLGHTHAQVVATPFVPDLIAAELRGAEAYHAEHGRCVFCDLLRDAGERVVFETDHFAAFAAFAPRFACELCVMPKKHAARFETLTESLELARLLKRALRALDAALAEPAYNLCLHAAPLRSPELDHFHWHFEILPRTSRPAGFEWGAGCYVIDTPPERAAAVLRAAVV
jgi:UDPglucose--hexose-1-phosphate uridylyltransferase